ncbi:MAG: glycosyltransferase family 2 protein [Acidobacteria bacterium]|nr:glycosyltransferase family 2 protein [Acidobacteriota bacterium]MBI3425571.1 glycosyltransferase family 2 protein [Acidobacteriota bacterium]
MLPAKVPCQITPLLLTYNEEPNIARTLASLTWADRVVVLDSGSNDDTETIARSFPNVDWRVRAFDSFKEQTEFGLQQTGIATEYVLALDADMPLSQTLVEEIFQRFLPGAYDGGLFSFQYCMVGQPLAGSLYPAQIRLFRRAMIQVLQVGHGHKFQLDGAVYQFKAPLFHDDRKPLECWITAQLTYSAQEMQRLEAGAHLKWRDRLRKWGVMPLLMGLYAYGIAGGPFRGAAAARYAYERAIFECLLAHRDLTARLSKTPPPES